MTTETDTAIDWKAADHVAGRLGAHTRTLVARGDAGAVYAWAMQMSHGLTGEFNGPRAASYRELAELVMPATPPELEEEFKEDDDDQEDNDDDD